MKGIVLCLMLMLGLIAFAQNEVNDSLQTHELNEVVIEGEKPQITAKDGILTVDLPALVKDKPVTNILEALGYIPGVIENNGMLALNGASGLNIILNGELTNMPIQNLYQLLYSTPIDRLKSVEVMYAAPAKYHVSGAVINIILKTPRPIDGLMGQLRATYNQERYASYFGGFAATYALKDWTFDANWSLSKEKDWQRQETFSNHLVNGERIMVDDDMRQIGKNLTNNLFASVAYKTFKIIYNGQFNSNNRNKSMANGTFGEYINDYSYLKQPKYNNIALKYTAKFGLTLGCDYTNYQESRSQHMTKKGIELLKASNRQKIDKYHIYADQEHQIGAWQINYGLEYQHSNDLSQQEYLLPNIDGFDDTMKEDVADGYVGVQGSFEWGLSFSASAKGEYYHNDYMHNWNFVPQLAATYFKTPKSIFQLTLTTERIYPQYWELHGATSHINDYSTIKGNPKLLPYLNYSGQLSYILRQKYAATLYLLYGDKYSVQLPYQQPDELQLLFQTVNLDFSRTFGLQIQAPFAVGSVWNSVAVANLMHKQEKCSKFHDISFDNKRWSFYGSLNNTILFSKECPISLSLDASYVMGQIQGPGKFNSFWKIDAGAKWKFGKKRSCELTLKCNDLFNTWNPKLRIKTSGQDYELKVHDMVRSLSISFIWRFNGFKPQETDVDTSRFGTGK